MKRRSVLATLAAASLVLAACGGDDDAAPTTEAPTTEAPAEEPADEPAEEPGDEPAEEPGDEPGEEPGEAAAGGTGNECTAGNTVTEGVLTAATGDPAFPPYVLDDAPESGEGFEAAVVAAVAREMGFSPDNVTWIRTGFNEVIAPGPKDFDFNIQQFSIRPDREEVVSFSDPYYNSNQAIVALEGSPAIGATSLEDLADIKFGAQIGTTSFDFIVEVIQPNEEPFVYDDNTAAKAALEAGQIDAIVLDLPTAFFVAAVEFENADVVAQFPAAAGAAADDFGMLFEKDNPLVDCVNAALATLRDSGELEAITQQWMADFTDAPVIEVD